MKDSPLIHAWVLSPCTGVLAQVSARNWSVANVWPSCEATPFTSLSPFVFLTNCTRLSPLGLCPQVQNPSVLLHGFDADKHFCFSLQGCAHTWSSAGGCSAQAVRTCSLGFVCRGTSACSAPSLPRYVTSNSGGSHTRTLFVWNRFLRGWSALRLHRHSHNYMHLFHCGCWFGIPHSS